MPVFSVADGTPATYSATSYVSVTEAGDYLSISPGYADSWAALSQSDKEKLLMFAARLMDTTIEYVGRKVSDQQVLEWPREGAYGCDGTLYKPDEIPQPIKNTAIEVAGYYAKFNDVDPFDPKSDQEGLRVLKVDVLYMEWFKGNISAATLKKYPRHIKYTLNCLGDIIYGGIGGVRFVKGVM